jgi:hypothetical protein
LHEEEKKKKKSTGHIRVIIWPWLDGFCVMVVNELDCLDFGYEVKVLENETWGLGEEL